MAITRDEPGKQTSKVKPQIKVFIGLPTTENKPSYFGYVNVSKKDTAGWSGLLRSVELLHLPKILPVDVLALADALDIGFIEGFSKSLRKLEKIPDLNEYQIRTVQAATRVFGNEDKANRWLNRPLKKLYGKTPLDIAQTEIGAEAVLEILGQIEHGMFA